MEITMNLMIRQIESQGETSCDNEFTKLRNYVFENLKNAYRKMLIGQNLNRNTSNLSYPNLF